MLALLRDKTGNRKTAFRRNRKPITTAPSAPSLIIRSFAENRSKFEESSLNSRSKYALLLIVKISILQSKHHDAH